MKRCLFLLFVLTFLLFACASAESNPFPLYPIRENGLWGYMNRTGEVVIEPQWNYADSFIDGTAIVGIGDATGMLYGIILQNGSTVVPIQYPEIEDCGDFCLIGEREGFEDGLVGWYDKASGYYQEPVWNGASDYPTDSGLILVDRYDDYAYIIRNNGQVAFSVECSGEPYWESTFHEGYAFWRIETYDDETDDFIFDEYLLDLQGNRVIFPEGILPYGDVQNGLLPIATDDEDDPQAGFARPDGTVIFMLPEGTWPITKTSEGRVFFDLDGKVGIMDLEGNLVLPPVLDYDPGYNQLGRNDEPAFHYGYALMMLCDSENRRSYVFISRSGQITLQIEAYPAPGISFSPCTFAMENGLAWYVKDTLLEDGSYATGYGLIRLAEQGGTFLTDPVFDRIAPHYGGFMEIGDGLMAVSMLERWGYIDETAQWVIEPRYDNASSFRDGLALVEKDGKLQYIDHDGNVVWQEP